MLPFVLIVSIIKTWYLSLLLWKLFLEIFFLFRICQQCTTLWVNFCCWGGFPSHLNSSSMYSPSPNPSWPWQLRVINWEYWGRNSYCGRNSATVLVISRGPLFPQGSLATSPGGQREQKQAAGFRRSMNIMERTRSQLQRDSSLYCSSGKVYKVA